MDLRHEGKALGLALQQDDELSGAGASYRPETVALASVVGPPIGAVPTIPDYLRDIYWWAYISERGQRILDRQLVVSAILWGNAARLTRTVMAELEPGQRVLQPASVYGTFCADLAEFVGPEGRLDVIDIVPSQVAISRRKLEPYPHATARVGDAAKPGAKGYDAVCCYFLLHEVPEDYKRRIVDALLGCVRPGGKVVFVDYHRPSALHPLHLPMSLMLDRLEPFAKSLWTREIASFARDADAFEWTKSTYFGGLYQKVVARHRQG